MKVYIPLSKGNKPSLLGTATLGESWNCLTDSRDRCKERFHKCRIFKRVSKSVRNQLRIRSLNLSQWNRSTSHFGVGYDLYNSLIVLSSPQEKKYYVTSLCFWDRTEVRLKHTNNRSGIFPLSSELVVISSSCLTLCWRLLSKHSNATQWKYQSPHRNIMVKKLDLQINYHWTISSILTRCPTMRPWVKFRKTLKIVLSAWSSKAMGFLGI